MAAAGGLVDRRPKHLAHHTAGCPPVEVIDPRARPGGDSMARVQICKQATNVEASRQVRLAQSGEHRLHPETSMIQENDGTSPRNEDTVCRLAARVFEDSCLAIT